MLSHFLLAALIVISSLELSGCRSRELRNRNLPTNVVGSTPNAQISPRRFRVTKVIDGDTIDVRDEHNNLFRVRLAGIDSPERGQPYSKVATEALSALVWNREVMLEGEKIDRFRRRVAKVLTDRDVCLEMVRKGLAWHFKKYEEEQSPSDRKLYDDAETKARTERTGLWQSQDPMPPWSIREQRRNGYGQD
ncbi:MAG: thermonuclease family protein [Acidobacteria bacterium]|nr:thermonuclease family protein [Acidobacteriota bacterium]